MADDVTARLGRRRTSIKNVSELLRDFEGDVPNAKRLYKANRGIFDSVAVDLVMPGTGGDDVTIKVAGLQPLVDCACDSSDLMRSLFRDLVQREPCSRQEPTKVSCFTHVL